jgi:pimeloyl-ACP methyl ester carboxylesterase
MENVQTKQGTRFIDGPEGTLFLNDAGNGNPPIVFAHSFAGSSLQWRHQLDFFRQHYRTIAFDFRNHGQSAAPVEADTFAAEEIADDIAAVIDHLNLPGFILVGHSMGGAAAIAYARRNTDRVAALVMVGTPGTTPPEQGKAIVDSLKTDQYQRVMDQYMTRILTNAKPQTREMIMAGINMVDQERSTNIVKAMFEFDSVTALKGYPGPRLIISTNRIRTFLTNSSRAQVTGQCWTNPTNSMPS